MAKRLSDNEKSLQRLNPVPLERVLVQGGFWGERLRVNREITIPLEYQHCKTSGRIDAFRPGWKVGDPRPPHIFWDSDVAKWIESAAYSLTTHPDEVLEKRVDGVIRVITSAQQDDGYLNSYFTAVEPEKRWTNLRDCHELYCAGHLIEAAVAYFKATGKKAFLSAVCRYADYIDTVFGRGRGEKRGYPGHEEIELALVKLYRLTGQQRYLNLASFFIEERGTTPHYFEKESKGRGETTDPYRGRHYDELQAHLPPRKQKTAEGHAVRACYLFAGMADVAAETGDKELLAACRAVWKNIVEKRMYIHGGIGSTRFDERFTFDYDLPNEEAYAETCAAIALVFFAHRMLQLEPDRAYADVMERALYNGILSGVSLDGRRFFYDNYLASIPETHPFTGQKPPVRQEWFGCACCPPNLARLLASLGQYAYSTTPGAIWIHLFINGEAEVEIANQSIRLVQKTEYPWEGDIGIDILPESPATFTLAVRIPGWCRETRVATNGKDIKTPAVPGNGYLKLRKRWQKGDRLELSFAMMPERIEAHPSVRHNCGRVALQRGPIVYCLEEIDNGKDLNDILLSGNTEPRVKKGSSGILKDIPIIEIQGSRRNPGEWKGQLYRPTKSGRLPCTVTAIPYFMWANRGEGEMLVWIRQAPG